jgi:hypothetical protein
MLGLAGTPEFVDFSFWELRVRSTQLLTILSLLLCNLNKVLYGWKQPTATQSNSTLTAEGHS